MTESPPNGAADHQCEYCKKRVNLQFVDPDECVNRLLRGDPNGQKQFVVRLNVIKLRRKKQRLGVELLGNSCIGLGPESLTSFELLRGNSAGLRTKREYLF